MENTLIIGYGNLDRQDDGVAWHVLRRLTARLNPDIEIEPEAEIEPCGINPECFFTLQLTPEIAELASAYTRLCFVDAHTGSIPDEIAIHAITAGFQNSPFTHHMTPETLLGFISALYNRQPEAILVSIRGFEFGFSRTLSAQTDELADEAVTRITKWVQTAVQPS